MALAKNRHLKTAVNFVYRYYPIIMHIKELISRASLEQSIPYTGLIFKIGSYSTMITTGGSNLAMEDHREPLLILDLIG